MLPSSLQATCVLVFAITTLTHSGVNASLNTGQDEILALVQESTHSATNEDDLHLDPISMFLDGFPLAEADAQPVQLISPSLAVISSARFEEDAAQLLRHRIPTPESGHYAVRAMQLKATAKEAEAACPSLSATELATVAKPSLDMTDIGSFVVFAVYLISAAALVSPAWSRATAARNS